MAPHGREFGEHAVRAELLVLPQTTVDGKLVIRHSLQERNKHVSVLSIIRQERKGGRTNHVSFVGLHVVLRDGLQLCRWYGVEEPRATRILSEGRMSTAERGECALVKDREVERNLGVRDEALEVRLRDRSDRVHVRTRAVVLCQIPSQTVPGGKIPSAPPPSHDPENT